MADKEPKLGDMLDICLELRGWNDCGDGSYEVKSQTIDAITTKLNNLFVELSSRQPDTELVEALELIAGSNKEGVYYTSQKAQDEAHQEAMLEWLNAREGDVITVSGSFYSLATAIAKQTLTKHKENTNGR